MRSPAALVDSAALFESLFASAPDAIVLVDRRGAIALVNAQAERLFSYDRAALVGQPIEILLPDRYRARHRDHRARYQDSPHLRPMGRDLELYGRHSDGSEFPIDIMLSPLEGDEGSMVIAIVRDVTERKRAERALQEKNVELENANRVKDRFLASMSHELRTPLNAIIGFSGTLLMKLAGPLTPDQEKQLGTIQASARQLAALINDVLDLARIESGRIELEFEEIDCREILEDARAALRTQAAGKSLLFEVQLLDVPLIVHTSRRAMSQIVVSLAGNAVKFTDAGSVTLRLAERSENGVALAEISVTDTGPGIRHEDQERLFLPFEQFAAEGSGRPDGAGLGLHLSKKLAELIGGRIEFESVSGRGSRFSLILPRGRP